jgi:hypothetical protein
MWIGPLLLSIMNSHSISLFCNSGSSCRSILFFVKHENKLEAEPGAAVKLLPSDQEVMGSSLGNSLL